MFPEFLEFSDFTNTLDVFEKYIAILIRVFCYTLIEIIVDIWKTQYTYRKQNTLIEYAVHLSTHNAQIENTVVSVGVLRFQSVDCVLNHCIAFSISVLRFQPVYCIFNQCIAFSISLQCFLQEYLLSISALLFR